MYKYILHNSNITVYYNNIQISRKISFQGCRGDYIIYLTLYYLYPCYRRQGHGTIIMDKVCGLLRNIGCKYLSIRNPTKIGRKFYTGYGFKKSDWGDLLFSLTKQV